MGRRRTAEDASRKSALNANARRPPLWRTGVWRAIWLANWTIVILFFGGLGTLAGVYYSIAPIVPRLRSISEVRSGEGTRILSADGKLLGRVSTEDREFLAIDRIPDDLKNAIIAVEDTRFTQHFGVDPRGILRAVRENLTSGELRQGASTITQQLARNVYDLSAERTLRRKIQEFVLALQIERSYTKDEILELYLNEIPLGERSFGVKVAAKVYFGKDPADLTLAECALLAGLPKGPTRYNPFRSPERALARRNLVLDRMAEVGYITQDRADMAKRQPIRLARRRATRGRRAFAAPHFCAYVLKEAQELVGQDRIDRGGLTIQTTLNWEMQQEAERVLIKGVEARRRQRVSQGALVAVDTENGAVKAMVGGVNPQESEFNRATQGNRPVGSAFKPFVYFTALDQGKTPRDRIVDGPVSYPDGRGGRWSPKNYDRKFSGRIDLMTAFRYSRNVPAVKLLDEVGVDNVIRTAQLMGLRHRMYPNLALALGTCSATPLEMAAAYSVIANGGRSVDPFGIVRIEDASGDIVYVRRNTARQIVRESTARTLSEMMQAVVERGTAASAWRSTGRKPSPAFGKTGTTSDNKDAWFVGWSQGLSCAVWVGNDRERTMPGVTGGHAPAYIWMEFMKVAAPMYASRRSEATLAAEHADGDEQLARLAVQAEQPESRRSRERLEPEGTTPDATVPAVPLHDEPSQDGLGPADSQLDTDASPADDPSARDRARTELREPDEVVAVCAVTGKLATSYCPRIVLRSFPRGRAPTSNCALHPDPFQER